MPSIHDEIARRRTFAIISHPDAGKTTLTEKLLLYGGAVELAGSVTARKKQRATTSDWMELEKKRGISISSTVLQFDYAGMRINLLDTPGHRDFSEDTYRVLTAVDAAIMVIDAGKGIETETRKLFEVCRKRGVPIFTFINKLDRPTLDPLTLIDELERVLGIHAVAMNWPLGTGPTFAGLLDRTDQRVHLFEKVEHGAYRAPERVGGVHDPVIRERLTDAAFAQFVEEVEMLDHVCAPFDVGAVHRGELTPVFFGSAMNNFGVQLLLDGFLQHSVPPASRQATRGMIDPDHEAFCGFVFKIQANMDPRHRDRLAFIRTVSGRFERDMTVTHAQSGKKMRLASAHSLFGRDRETVNEAFAGDVIGIVITRDLRIGDTLTEDPTIIFDEIPRFAPECFSYIENPNPSDYKRFDQGLNQLLQEGVVQSFSFPQQQRKTPLLGAVGPLQFDIVRHRLEAEYQVEARLRSTPWCILRWLACDFDAAVALSLPYGATIAADADRNPVLLCEDEWALKNFIGRHADLGVSEHPAKRMANQEVADVRR